MTADSLIIREAGPGDLPALRPAFADVHAYHVRVEPGIFRDPGDEYPSTERHGELIDGEDRAILLGELDGEVIGFVTVQEVRTPDWSTHVPRRLLIVDTLSVRAAWCGRGYGTALMEAAHAWAAGRGIDEAELSVFEFNRPALRLYERLGYETSRRRLTKRSLAPGPENTSAPAAPWLTDGVVVLDGHTYADVDAHRAGEDEEQARRFGWYPHRSTEQTVRTAIERWREAWRTGGVERAFALRAAESETLMGGVELRLRGDRIAHLSYWVFPRYRGQGLAARAIRLAADYAFRDLQEERVEAYIEPDNVASRRAVERAGFREEGVLRRQATVGDARRDMVLYAKLPIDP
jgi:RimJ/RimL family protein N-acetyltransferase